MTCSAKIRSVSVSELMVSASSATSPLVDTVIFCDRSPCAIAVVTWEIERTWLVRLDAIVFTESVRSRQVPATPRTSAWPPSLPSVPTSRATRVTSSANDESWSTIVLTVRPMRTNSPPQRPTLDLVRHGLRQVAIGDRGDDAGDLRRRSSQVVDERVKGAGPVGPGAVEALLVEALRKAPPRGQRP